MNCSISTCDNEAVFECPKCNGAWCSECADNVEWSEYWEYKSCPFCESILERIEDEQGKQNNE